MPTDSQLRRDLESSEISRLRDEIGQLRRKLVEERADRAVQNEVQTVLSSLYSSPTVAPEEMRPGHSLDDGRFVPSPIVVGGTCRPPEPGTPRPATNNNLGSRTEDQMRPINAERSDDFEFAPDDESATAFDQFMSAHDPHLELTRRFLLG